MVMDTIISRKRRCTSFGALGILLNIVSIYICCISIYLEADEAVAHHLLQCLQCITHETNWRRTIVFVIVFAHWIYIYEIKKNTSCQYTFKQYSSNGSDNKQPPETTHYHSIRLYSMDANRNLRHLIEPQVFLHCNFVLKLYQNFDSSFN